MASSTNFSGLGSGIDFSLITDSIIAARSRPLQQLVTKQADFRGRTDAFKQLNSKLIAFKDAANALTDRSLGTGRSASSSNNDVVGASASTSAAIANINVNVTRLASNLSQASDSFATTQSAVLANGQSSATFELRKGGASSGVAITIDANNNSLTGLRDAINAAGAGISATIVDVSGNGSENQLVLNSKETGSAGRVELVETSSTGTANKLNIRTLNEGGLANLDAAIKVNGLTITRSSNTISDAVNGVTLNLKNTGAASVNISANTGSFKTKIANFVDAFNGVQDFINTQFKPDAQGRPSGILAADVTLRAVQQGLRDAVNNISSGNGGAFSNLTEVGIGRDENGKLTLNQDQINDKLANAFADVQALFNGKTGAQTGLANSITTATNNLSTNIQTAISGFDSSIARINESINAQQSRLDTLRSILTRQFSVADAAIGQLNQQNTALSNVLKSFEPRSS